MEEVSKMLHISISSLRHYENIRLLTPAYISPDSGYRYAGHGAAGHALRCSSN
nr:MerR family DNA-binding transcriptional regulator [Phascolarctobacterium succinatutens]